MISSERFLQIRNLYGHFASWAVWAEEGIRPKENIGDLSVLNPDENPNLLHTLQGETIFIGLNISRKIERPFGNFHDPRPMATDFKIRSALMGTRFWGSYMTDIIKDFEEKASGKMMSYLKSNKEFERDNIRSFIEEIQHLAVTNPHLIVFGKDAELITQRNLGNEFRITQIPHYAGYMSKDAYRTQVNEILSELN